MWVKICGTTSLQDARQAIDAGADALGFIFAPSKRRVTVDQAAAITRELPEGVLRVGVFTEPEAICEAVRGAGLTAVQMHWPYEAATVAALATHLGDAVQLWQVVGFAVDPSDPEKAEARFVEELGAALGDPRLTVVLLDAVKGGVSGGQGQSFAWEQARAMVQRAMAAAEGGGRGRLPELVVAGGLHAGNVGEAVAVLGPWGVDVVSGVEQEPGVKSPERLRAFFRAVRG